MEEGRMNAIIESPAKALLAGLAIAGLVLVLWIATAGVDPLGLVSYVLRFLHVIGAMVWVGLIWFVNVIQLKAVAEADEPARAALQKWIVRPVAKNFRHASHLTVVSGVLLLLTTGYLLDRWIFASTVYVPPLRNLLLWGGTLAGAAMWVFANLLIWPSLRVLLGETPADPAAKAAARERVRFYARLNLILALPVTFVMVAAAHLY
jgi:uncharacterized membrane protein